MLVAILLQGALIAGALYFAPVLDPASIRPGSVPGSMWLLLFVAMLAALLVWKWCIGRAERELRQLVGRLRDLDTSAEPVVVPGDGEPGADRVADTVVERGPGADPPAISGSLLTRRASGASSPIAKLDRAVHTVRGRVERALQTTRSLRAQAEDVGTYRTAFLRAVSHELRTPLNAILGFSELLLSGIEGPLTDDRRENLEMIRAAGRRLLSLFNDAIELSAMAAGQLSLRREQVDVAGLVEEVVESLEESRGLRPVHVIGDVGEGVPAVRAQRDKLQRILLILGRYALSKTEAGAVQLTARIEEGRLSIRVAGDGVGLSAAEAASACMPEQAQDAAARRDALRLAIAEQLTVLHRGTFEPLATVSGPCFLLTLPVGPSDSTAPRVPLSDPSGAKERAHG